MSESPASAGIQLGISGLNRAFGEREVLKRLALDIPAGQFVAVVGQSGGGKSTLLRLLAGLDRPDGGQVLADGEALAPGRDDVRIMFQDARLLPWKRVLDNVGLGLAGDWRPRAAKALAEVGLAERGGEWPAVLSGGQRQRVALARALVHRPRLLLLDEPFGALDALTRREMHKLLVALWRAHGFTVLLVTHDVGEAVALADRVLLIEDGGVALDQPVPLPHPRAHSNVELIRLEDRILHRLQRRPLVESPPPAEPAPIFPARLQWAL